MGDPSSNGLLDLIYEAALDVDLWTHVLERVADHVGGEASVLTQLNIESGAGLASPARTDPEVMDRFYQHYAYINPLQIVTDPDEYVRTWTPRILTDEDWMRRDELVRTEYYNDFLRPIQADWSMMIRLDLQGANISAINIARRLDRGRFDSGELQSAAQLHSHLRRSFALGRKLNLTRSLNDDIAEALYRSEHAMFVLDASGHILHLNRVGERLLARPSGLISGAGRLMADSAPMQQRLAALIGLAGSSDAEQRRGGTMRLPLIHRPLPLSIAVSPVRAERLSIFSSGPTVLVCATDPNETAVPPGDRLRELFSLTAAESRVALALLEGSSPQEISARYTVSINTIRVQISSIFFKTGARRQSELIRVLTMAGLSKPDLGHASDRQSA